MEPQPGLPPETMSRPAHTSSAPCLRHVRLWLTAPVIFLALLFSYTKSFIADIFELRTYFWLVSYRYGLIRRGLVGTLVTPLRHLFSDDKQYLMFISSVYHTAALAILVGLFGWAISHAHKAATPTTFWLAITAVFLLAVSPMVGNQAYLAGWLDVFLMAIAWVCFVCIRNRRYVAAGVLSFAAVFAHEVFLFFWVPCVCLLFLHWLASLARRRSALAFAVLALVPVAAGVVIALCESPAAAVATVQASSLDAWTKNTLVGLQFQYTPLGIFKVQMQLLAQHGRNFLLSSAYALLPPLLVVCSALVIARSRCKGPGRAALYGLRLGTLALLGLGPALVLLVNWDLSRTMAWSSFSALLLLVEVLDSSTSTRQLGRPPVTRTEHAPGWGATAALAALMTVLGLLLLSWPLVYTYFDVADLVLPRGYVPRMVTEGAHTRALAHAIAFYNVGHERPGLESAPVSFSCEFLASSKAQETKTMHGCEFILTDGAVVYGPYRRFRQGAYAATFRFSVTQGCPGGVVRVEVVAGDEVRDSAEVTVTEEDREQRLQFQAAILEEVVRTLQFRTYGTSGCVILKEVTITPGLS
jgi:hypothetical protein